MGNLQSIPWAPPIRTEQRYWPRTTLETLCCVQQNTHTGNLKIAACHTSSLTRISHKNSWSAYALNDVLVSRDLGDTQHYVSCLNLTFPFMNMFGWNETIFCTTQFSSTLVILKDKGLSNLPTMFIHLPDLTRSDIWCMYKIQELEIMSSFDSVCIETA